MDPAPIPQAHSFVLYQQTCQPGTSTPSLGAMIGTLSGRAYSLARALLHTVLGHLWHMHKGGCNLAMCGSCGSRVTGKNNSSEVQLG
jgi:hypothetical protein